MPNGVLQKGESLPRSARQIDQTGVNERDIIGGDIDRRNAQKHFCFQETALFSCCCCYPAPLERWGMAEDHGAPEAGQLSRVWTRGHKETENRPRASGAKSP